MSVGDKTFSATLDSNDKLAQSQRPGADGITYDNSTSGLAAENVKAAIDELAGKKIDTAHLEDGAVTESKIGSGAVTGDKLGQNAVSENKVADSAITPVKLNLAAIMHRNIYRGKNLGTGYTAEQKAQVQAGTFYDLYVGDYWVINGVNWRIADIDYWYGKGDTACNTHHLVIVPDTNLYTAKMNDSNVTTGGYVGSAMCTTNLANAKSTIETAFGAANILSKREYFTNAVTNGKASGGAWVDSKVDLMNEINVYGCPVFTPANDGSTIPANYTIDNSQFSLFRLNPTLICNRSNWWLRDVVSSALFAYVYRNGFAAYDNASAAYGVRPAFAIC